MPSSVWLFGLLLGMRHALEPDHLAAVSTLVVEQRRATSGAILGGLWGVGHTVALLVVASLLALAGAAMPPRLATLFELGVALMLIAIGFRSMRDAPRQARHEHQHGHAPMRAGARTTTGTGTGTRTGEGNGIRAKGGRYRFARRSLLFGCVHGLAGSGALTALVASRLATTPGRLFYVALFGLGSVMGMALLSGIVGWPLARLGRSPTVARLLTTGTGMLAVGLGIVWGLPLVRELLS